MYTKMLLKLSELYLNNIWKVSIYHLNYRKKFLLKNALKTVKIVPEYLNFQELLSLILQNCIYMLLNKYIMWTADLVHWLLLGVLMEKLMFFTDWLLSSYVYPGALLVLQGITVICLYRLSCLGNSSSTGLLHYFSKGKCHEPITDDRLITMCEQ